MSDEKMPEGWKRVAMPQRTTEYEPDLCPISRSDLAAVDKLMKGMSEAMEGIEDLAVIRIPTEMQTRVDYQDILVLKKWREWK